MKRCNVIHLNTMFKDMGVKEALSVWEEAVTEALAELKDEVSSTEIIWHY